MARKQRIVSRLSQGHRGLPLQEEQDHALQGPGPPGGRAQRSWSRARTGETKVTTKNVILATGSRPRSLPGLDARRQVDRHLRRDPGARSRCPKSLIVIGAGAVGIEFASIFARFGVDGDRDRAAAARAAARGRGDLGRGAEAAGQVHDHPHRRQDRRRAQDRAAASRSRSATRPARPRRVTAEMLLVAVGRGPGHGRPRPRVHEGPAGEAATSRVERDAWRPTSRASSPSATWSRSTASPHPQLAHVASAEGIGVAERLAGKNTEPVNYDRVPSATYCQPEVAGVGLTEAEAKKRGYDVKVGKFNFGNLAKPRIIGHDGGFVKVVSDGEVRRGAGRAHGRPPRHRPHLRGLRRAAARVHDRGDRAHDPSRTRRCPRRSCRPPRPSTATPSTPRTGRPRSLWREAPGRRARQGAAARALSAT